eukprot:Em0005g947a
MGVAGLAIPQDRRLCNHNHTTRSCARMVQATFVPILIPVGDCFRQVRLSPSPEPIYSHDGKRLNTREVRVRKKLEDERHDLIQKAVKSNPGYKPPADYKPATKKFEDKVFIPQDDHPETNFVGLLIGPRGNTLKQLEKDTNTKIMIRGKGATKEGKLGRTGLPQPGEDEPLHALITGQTPEVVKDAVDRIKKIIQSGIDNPGNDNELKQLQLQQLAELNGTFKPIDVLRCRNCGSPGHRSWECSEQKNVVSNIICTRCGGGGHIASDCKTDISGNPPIMSAAERAKMDSEYMSLMKELGETVPGMTSNSSNSYKNSSSNHGNGQQQPLLGAPQTYEGMGGEDQAAAAAAFGAYAPWFAPHPGLFGHPGMLMHPGAPPPWMGHPMMAMQMAPGVSGEEGSEGQQAGGIPPWQVMNPWQQGMMYPMGMMPGMPTANGSPAPPPPPPEQNWNAGAPQPPPPETTS